MVLDGHSDLLYDVTRRRIGGETRVLERVHLPQLRRGGVEGLVLALWTSTAHGETFWEDTPWRNPDAALDRTWQQMTALSDELRETPALRLVRTAAEAEAARAQGKLYLFLAVEGMAAIGADLRGLEWYWRSGVRLGTLTWNEENLLATGSGGDPYSGLTDLGKRAVGRMQELGMVVDVSHLNDGGFRDVMKLARGPVAASHSNCRKLCDVRRNLSDEQLRAIRDTGGVVGINSYHGFVHADPSRQTAETLARHAAHMADVMGIEHVACGFDFCGYMGPPDNDSARGIEDAGQVPEFFRCLERLGMTARERELVARENFLRILAGCPGGAGDLFRNSEDTKRI